MIETKKSFCRFCMAFCGLELDVDVKKNRAVAVRGDPENPVSRGYTCLKGRAALEQLYHPDRLLSSKKRVDDGWTDIGSEQALDEIAWNLGAIKDKYGPRSIAVYLGNGGFVNSTGPGPTKTWLDALGSTSYYTSLTIDCPGLLVAAHRLFGTGVTPLGLDSGVFDIANAKVALFIGTNPLISHRGHLPHSNPWKELRDAQKRGMKLIVVDPRRTETARRADLHLQIKPGEDSTLLAGMIKIIIERRLHDQEYVKKYVSGLDDLHEVVKEFDLEYVSLRTQLPADQILQAAEMFATAKSGAARQGTGLTMGPHGNLSIHLVLVLNALCGRIDRTGGLVRNPGVLSRPLPENARPVTLPLLGPSKARMGGLRGLFTAPGYMEMPTATLPDEILEPGEGKIRALIVQGGNPVLSFPNQEKTVRALKELDLLVCIDPFMSETAKFADYVMAPKHYLERPDVTMLMDGYFSVPYAQYTPAMVKSPPGLLEEWEIFWGLSRRMGLTLKLPGLGKERKPRTDNILDALTANSRIPLEEVRKYGSGRVFGNLAAGDVVPHMIDYGDKRMAAGHPEVIVELREVRAESIVEGGGYEATSRFTHRLISARVPEVFNSTGQNLPLLRKNRKYNPAFMNPTDVKELGIQDDTIVTIDSGFGQIKAIVEGTPDVRRGVIAMSHAWGTAPQHDGEVRETGSSTGRLIPDDERLDSLTGMPLQTAVPVNVYADAGNH